MTENISFSHICWQAVIAQNSCCVRITCAMCLPYMCHVANVKHGDLFSLKPIGCMAKYDVWLSFYS